jgi:hypothetical protein
MAAPNLYAINSVQGFTNSDGCPTSLTTILSNPALSNEVLRINSLYISNIQSTNASIDIVFRKNNVNNYIAFNNPVNSGTTSVIITRETFIYIEEGCSILVKASVTGHLQYVISYEKIS